MSIIPEELILSALAEARENRATLAALGAVVAGLRVQPAQDLSGWERKLKAMLADAAARDVALSGYGERVRELTERLDDFWVPIDAALAEAKGTAAAELQAARNEIRALLDDVDGVITEVKSQTANSIAVISSEQAVLADADAALTVAINSLTATVNDPTTGLANAHARVTTEEAARAGADSALAGSISTVESTINNPTTGLANAHARITTEETTRANADTALSDRTTTLESTVNHATTGLAATVARVGTIETTYATQNFAIAKREEAISAAAADATAKVSAEAVARAGVDGYLASKYTLQVAAGNVVTGLILTSVDDNGTPTSDVTFKAANFKVITDVAGVVVTPFQISGGTVRMSGSLIVDETITAAKIESTLTWSKNFVVGAGGNIRQGKANYADTGAGFFLGDSTGPKFYIGSALDAAYLKFDGTGLAIKGTLDLLTSGSGGEYLEARAGLVKQGNFKIETIGSGTYTSTLTMTSGDGSKLEVLAPSSAVPVGFSLKNSTGYTTISLAPGTSAPGEGGRLTLSTYLGVAGSVLSPSSLSIEGNQVVGPRQGAITDLAAYASITGAQTVSEGNITSNFMDLRAKVSAIQAALRAHGLIAT